MNVDSKVWNFSGNGAKVHAYINGRTAACRSNIVRPAGVDMDYCEAKQSFKFSLCANCETKFDAAVERAEASMQPSTGEGDHLPPAAALTEAQSFLEDTTESFPRLVEWKDGLRKASMQPSTGEGDHLPPAATQGPVCPVCQQVPSGCTCFGKTPSARVADHADHTAHAEAAQAEAEQHMADNEPQTLQEIIWMVDALGGDYLTERDGREVLIRSHRQVVRVLDGLDEFGMSVSVMDCADGSGWYIQIMSAAGRQLGQYHYVGR